MYEFLLEQYKNGSVDSTKLQTYVPIFITQKQFDSIIAIKPYDHYEK